MAKKRKFPTTIAGKMALANEMADGFEQNTNVYPAPKTDAAAQKDRLRSVQDKINAVTQLEAQLIAARVDLNGEIELMEDEMRDNLDYAEVTVGDDDAQLKLIGWSGRAEPQKLQPPGQARMLEILKQGAGWVQFDWKEPTGGGKVQVYKVLCREIKQGGDMKEVGSAIISEVTLVEQPRGVELEYAVAAVNKAGAGEPSNSITITL